MGAAPSEDRREAGQGAEKFDFTNEKCCMVFNAGEMHIIEWAEPDPNVFGARPHVRSCWGGHTLPSQGMCSVSLPCMLSHVL